jgi:hypothetical protein
MLEDFVILNIFVLEMEIIIFTTNHGRKLFLLSKKVSIKVTRGSFIGS